MPTAIIYTDVILTCRFFSFSASTLENSVTASLSFDGDVFFSTSLAAFDGIITIYDIGSIIEEYFRKIDIHVGDITISIGDTDYIRKCLYCEYSMPTEFDPSKAFLSTVAAHRVHASTPILLSLLSTPDAPYIISVVGHKSDGTLATVRLFSPDNGSLSASFSTEDIINMALNKPDDALSDVAYFAVNKVGKQKVFYIVEHPFFLRFAFKNIFNVREIIDIPCCVTSRTVVERDSSICLGRYVSYNQTAVRSYELVTGLISVDEAATIGQLINSRAAWLCTDDGELPVIITDHTDEISNDDESERSIKFSFRFAGVRPYLFGNDISHMMPSKSIFTNHFTLEYL